MMKPFLSFAIGLAGIAVLFTVIPIASAQSQADQLTDEQRTRIVTNCTSIKNTLTQLKASDALLRVNRGQAYESLSGRLMDTFNARLTNNGLDATAMLTVTGKYDTALNTFRSTYQAYERQLTVALRTDCINNPDVFHTAVQAARTKRTAVHDQVLQLHQQIDDYKTVVNDFYQDYKRVLGTNR